jgi:hypothetical protein
MRIRWDNATSCVNDEDRGDRVEVCSVLTFGGVCGTVEWGNMTVESFDGELVCLVTDNVVYVVGMSLIV